MKNKPVTSLTPELRRQAEARLSEREDERVEELYKTNADLQRLVHELQVHQVELEMQNEELMQTRKQLERTLDMYVGLYTLARVAYFTVAPDSTIRNTNLTGAKLIGLERDALVGQRFDSFIPPDWRIFFRAFLNKLFTTRDKAICEVYLEKNGAVIPVHIVGACDATDEQIDTCYMLVSEVTEPKH